MSSLGTVYSIAYGVDSNNAMVLDMIQTVVSGCSKEYDTLTAPSQDCIAYFKLKVRGSILMTWSLSFLYLWHGHLGTVCSWFFLLLDFLIHTVAPLRRRSHRPQQQYFLIPVAHSFCHERRHFLLFISNFKIAPERALPPFAPQVNLGYLRTLLHSFLKYVFIRERS